MKRYLWIACFFSLIGLSGQAFADDCWGAGNTLEIVACFEEGNAKIEDQMGKTLARLQQIAKGLDDVMLNHLNSSQEKWLAYRKDYCAYYADYLRSGTGYGPMSLECENKLTQHRADELAERLQWFIDKGH